MAEAARESKTKEQVATQIQSSLTGSLASLPASFTNFLLSILDSPAYNNLTSSFCNDDFNTQTPDDPRVRYFSVAGRAPTVNLWHPLWLPKMVVDAWEKKERARLRELGDPNADNDSEWGNDGLVAIRSARWGEFLGTVDGCDHWEIRGARGIELDIDIPALQSVSLSIPSVNLHEWDWPNWLSAWRRDEGAAKVKALADEAAEVSSAAEKSSVKVEMSTGTLSSTDADSQPADATSSDGTSSSEKLSTVFNWVAQNTPSTDALSKVTASVSNITGGNKTSNPEDAEAAVQGTNRKGERNELATKTDLERFYVALCRKLYDEGL
jgi:triacylglycerol lipase